MASVGLIESPLAACVRVTGDLSAGVLLHQIRFHFKVGKMACRLKDGRKAVAKSNPDWAKETGLSLRRVKGALDTLRGQGIIETEVRKFNGAPTNHIHLNAARLEALESDRSSGSRWTDGPVQSEPMDRSVSNRSYTERSSERSTERSSASLRSATPVKRDPEVETMAGDDRDPDNVIRVNFRKEDPTMADATEKYRKRAGETLTKGKASGEKTLTDHLFLWKKRVGLLYPGYVKDFTGQERGQLKLFISKVGGLSFDVLDHTLQHWAKFGFEARQEYGLSTVPDRPVVGWLLKYHDVAVREFENAVNCTAKKAVGGAIQASPPAFVSRPPAPTSGTMRPPVEPKSVPVEEAPVTKDDIAAALAAIRAGKG